MRSKRPKWIIVCTIIFSIQLFRLIPVAADTPEVQINRTYRVGDVIGSFARSQTKVAVSVNNNEHDLSIADKYIPAYTVNNELCIIVEDLVYYGYTAIWNPRERTTKLYIGEGKKKTRGTAVIIKNRGNIYYTDIKIYVDGQEVPAYNIKGYSLVKLSDLSDKTDNLQFKKIFADDGNFYISGEIMLPTGHTAPAEGLKITPVCYYFDGGRLAKYAGEEYSLPPGNSRLEYKIQLPVRQHWNKMGFADPRIYNYMGYEITGTDGDYLSYDLENSTNTQPLYVERLNYYQDNYNDINIKILPRQRVKMELALRGDGLELFQDEETREVSVVAVDSESNKYLKKATRIGCRENAAELELDLVKNREYKFYFHIAVFGSISASLPLPPSPQYPTFYYHQGQGVLAETGGEIVTAGSGNADLKVRIGLPDLLIGDVYPGGKKVIYDSRELPVYLVKGQYLIGIKEFADYGRSIFTFCNTPAPWGEPSAPAAAGKSPGKLLVSNSQLHDDGNSIPIYWLKRSNTLEELVLLEDLQKLELAVHEHGEVIEITDRNHN
ncbi:MAG: hypothetical protein ACOWWO_05190 [Peptococcaceae bacterium]